MSGVIILEDLPNELFIEVLTYLTSIDIILTFGKLNHRFQSLITQYCKRFDFQFINKFQCDSIFRVQNTNQWTSLRLSDDDQKPFWIDHLLENYISKNNFSQLQFLSVGSLKDNARKLFFSMLSSLPNLVSLSIDSVCGEDILPFDLPKLQKLVFGSCLHIDWIQVGNRAFGSLSI